MAAAAGIGDPFPRLTLGEMRVPGVRDTTVDRRARSAEAAFLHLRFLPRPPRPRLGARHRAGAKHATFCSQPQGDHLAEATAIAAVARRGAAVGERDGLQVVPGAQPIEEVNRLKPLHLLDLW